MQKNFELQIQEIETQCYSFLFSLSMTISQLITAKIWKFFNLP